MSDIIEIYVCRRGQRLTEGRLTFSREILNRDQASEDAAALCARDRTIDRVVYYRMNEAGESRLLLTYVNPMPARVASCPPGRFSSAQRHRNRLNPGVASGSRWGRATKWITGLFCCA